MQPNINYVPSDEYGIRFFSPSGLKPCYANWEVDFRSELDYFLHNNMESNVCDCILFASGEDPS